MSAPTSVITSNGDGELLDDSPGDALAQRLKDPQIAASLSTILDHADLLAILVVGVGGFIRRAETISDSLVSSVAEVRQAASAAGTELPLAGIDVAGLGETLGRLGSALVDAAPALEKLLHSPLTDPQTADVLADLGSALLEGKRAADADRRGPKGVFALMKSLKDPDVSRGLGFMIHIARAFGRKLGT